MNKNYYEFIFISDQGKNITVKVTNAIETYEISQFVQDMNSIISSEIISTSNGKPVAKRFVKYIVPEVINVPVEQN